MVLVDETRLLEKESRQVSAVQLAHLIQLHVELHRLDRHLLVCESIDHICKEPFEGSLVALDGQRGVLAQLSDILLTRIEA